MSETKNKIKAHYDAIAPNYYRHYDEDKILDTAHPYPANYFRLQHILDAVSSLKIDNLLDIGVGEGTPLSYFAQKGINTWGMDLSPEMVKKAKQTMLRKQFDPDKIFCANIEEPCSYQTVLSNNRFDVIVSVGVMPHVSDDNKVLTNIKNLLKPGGRVFIEFRNILFSMFTFNRHTMDFIMNDLLVNSSAEIKNLVKNELSDKLRMDMPPIRDNVKNSSAPGYDQILAKFHNPLTAAELFKNNGFSKTKLHWYHFHPTMPYLTPSAPVAFREAAVEMEKDPSDWRGHFLCSAYVVEAEIE